MRDTSSLGSSSANPDGKGVFGNVVQSTIHKLLTTAVDNETSPLSVGPVDSLGNRRVCS